MKRRLTIALACLASLATCGKGKVVKEERQIPPGLIARPAALAYLCIAPGCTNTEMATIEARGNRDLAIKRVVFDNDGTGGFSVAAERDAPFILRAGQTFTVSVTFEPGANLNFPEEQLLITYSDASNDELDPERVPPGELRIPLVPRLVGEPVLIIDPLSITFPPVAVGGNHLETITITNEGFGNIPVGIESVVSDLDAFVVGTFSTDAIASGDSISLDVSYAPQLAEYSEGSLTITSADPGLEPVVIPMLGTSITDPSIDVRPGLSFDFGEIPVHSFGQAGITVQNLGASALVISSLASDAVQDLTLIADDLDIALGVLATTDITAIWQPTVSGPFTATVSIGSNDPDEPTVGVGLSGLAIEPLLDVTPTSIDFGIVSTGWTISETVELTNVGHGNLDVERIVPLVGTSTLFTLTNLPTFPVILARDESMTFDVEFRGDTPASFIGTLSIDSNDAFNTFIEIPLAAVATDDCSSVCSLPNASSSCVAGRCDLDSCDSDFYDVDTDHVNGCECSETSSGGDPGGACGSSTDIGTSTLNALTDDGGDPGKCVMGILPFDNDEDMYRFWYDDILFGTEMVRIELVTDDPDIEMCVYRYPTANHDTQCFFDPAAEMQCPLNDIAEFPGGTGSADEADYIIKVFRTSGSASCQDYTVEVTNGNGANPCGF